MLGIPDLTRRRLEPEVMDDPALDARSHRQALDGLRTVNRLSGSAAIVWRTIRDWARSERQTSLRILDLASGGGDVAVGVWRRASRAGLDVRILGLERSPLAIEIARGRAAATDGGVEFQQADVVADAFPDGFPVITCSLFLHHLDEPTAVGLLRKMGRAAGLLVVNDLNRSPGGYVLAQAACRLLTRSPVVQADGPASIAAAFTVSEARSLCQQAGLERATIQRHWPSRLLICWSRGSQPARSASTAAAS